MGFDGTALTVFRYALVAFQCMHYHQPPISARDPTTRHRDESLTDAPRPVRRRSVTGGRQARHRPRLNAALHPSICQLTTVRQRLTMITRTSTGRTRMRACAQRRRVPRVRQRGEPPRRCVGTTSPATSYPHPERFGRQLPRRTIRRTAFVIRRMNASLVPNQRVVEVFDCPANCSGDPGGPMIA